MLRLEPILGSSSSAITQVGLRWRGWPIELKDESLLVIQAMPLRDRCRDQYEEVQRWRR
jgi:hypothetical protein